MKYIEWSHVYLVEPRFYVNSCDRSSKRQRQRERETYVNMCDCTNFHSSVSVEKKSDLFCFYLLILKALTINCLTETEQNINMQIQTASMTKFVPNSCYGK